MSKYNLPIVIPAYNETKNIQSGALDKVYQYLTSQKLSYEVLIVDDGSTDETALLITEAIKDKPGFVLIKNEHGGKAITVMTGLLKGQGEIILFTDMDQATPLSEVEKFLPEFKNGADIVIGSRGGRKGAPLIRKLYAFGFVLLRNLILGLPVKDTQCGFKAFTKEAVDLIFPKLLLNWQKMTTGGAAVNAGFDIEMLFMAKKKNLKIVEIPVVWQYVGSERVGISAAIEAFFDMIKIRINDFRGKY